VKKLIKEKLPHQNKLPALPTEDAIIPEYIEPPASPEQLNLNFFKSNLTRELH